MSPGERDPTITKVAIVLSLIAVFNLIF